MSEKIIVLKFGSSVLRTSDDLPNTVHEIHRWVRSGLRVIAVVSAIGDATDRLLANARALSPVCRTRPSWARGTLAGRRLLWMPAKSSRRG